MRVWLAGCVVLLGMMTPCRAEEASEAPSSKASTFEKFDWSDAYVGAQLGYCGIVQLVSYSARRARTDRLN